MFENCRHVLNIDGLMQRGVSPYTRAALGGCIIGLRSNSIRSLLHGPCGMSIADGMIEHLYVVVSDKA